MLVISLIFGLVNMIIFSIGIKDFSRKRYFMKMLTSLIDLEAQQSSNPIYCMCIPTLNVLSPVNIRRWYSLRNVALDMGKQYTIRIFIIVFMFALCYGLYGAYLSFAFIGIIKADIPWTTYVIQFFDILLVYAILFTMLVLGAETNSYFQKHRTVLIELKHRLYEVRCRYRHYLNKTEYSSKALKTLMHQFKQLDLSDEDRNEKIDVITFVIDSVIERLDNQSQSNMLKLLGFT